jgi:hypothetical protein
MIFDKFKGQCNKLESTPRLNKPKLICVTALISFILLTPAYSLEEENTNSPISANEKATNSPLTEGVKHKYPIEELQQRAIELSPEIAVIDQAIKVMKSKKWTALAPNVGIGNNFASRNKDIRFNVNFDLVETFGGGKIREINLDVAQLELRKLELENKLKIEVLEGVLSLESAERAEAKYYKRLSMVEKKGRLFEYLYKEGEKEFEALLKYWEAIDELDTKIQDANDKVLLEKAKLEQLVGDLNV